MRKNQLSHMTFLAVCLAMMALIITSSACVLPWQSSEEAEATGTLEVITTGTPETLLEETATPETSSNDAGLKTTGKECLKGTWELDAKAAQSYLMMTMVGNNELRYTPSGVSGDNSLLVTSDEMRMVSNDFKVDMVNNDKTISVLVNGTAYGDLSATNTKFTLTDIVYNISGSLVEPFRTSEMNLNTLLNFAQSLSFASIFSKPPTELDFVYSCAGDTLSVKINEYASLSLNRTEN